MITSEMKKELIDGLLQIFQDDITQIILYGSVARGEETEESDIDIAIILRNELSLQQRDEFITWASLLDLKYERVFSIIDIAKDSLEKWGKIVPFYQNIQQEGIILWKAA